MKRGVRQPIVCAFAESREIKYTYWPCCHKLTDAHVIANCRANLCDGSVLPEGTIKYRNELGIHPASLSYIARRGPEARLGIFFEALVSKLVVHNPRAIQHRS